MAVKDTNPQEQFAAAATAAAQQPVQTQVPPAPEQQAAPQINAGYTAYSASSILNETSRTFGRSSAGEAVVRFFDTVREIVKNKLGDSEDVKKRFRISILDNKVRQTALSAIVISARGPKTVYHHRLLVQSSGILNNFTLNSGPQNIEIVLTPGDVDDNTFIARAVDQVSADWGITQNGSVTFHDAGAQVLPEELDPSDVDRVHAVVFNAFAALETLLADEVGEKPFSVKTHTVASDQFNARVDYHPFPAVTANGLPSRSDVAVLLAAKSGGAHDYIHATTKELARVDGFVDIIYMTQQQPVFGQVMVNPRYAARFVITNATPLTTAVTLERELFSLLPALMLNRNYGWAPTFRPRAGTGKEINLRDIGAIGLEMPELLGVDKPTRIPTQVSAFGDKEFYELIRSAFLPTMVVSLDVEECGELSWLNLVFIAAAQGNVDAQQRIVNAIDNLTNGAYRNHSRGLLVQPGTSRIHLGYYIDDLGNRRDLRDMDYLYMLNFFSAQNAIQSLLDWQATYEDTTVPEQIRLQRRLAIMTAVNPSVKVTGYAQRVNFVGTELQAIENAVAEAGISIQDNNITAGNIGYRQRGLSGVAELAMSQQNGLLFNTTPIYNNVGQRFLNAGARWNR